MLNAIATLGLLSAPLLFFEVKFHISFSVCQWGYGKEGDRCVACPVGSYGNFNSQLCEPCPSGTTNAVAAITWLWYVSCLVRLTMRLHVLFVLYLNLCFSKCPSKFKLSKNIFQSQFLQMLEATLVACIKMFAFFAKFIIVTRVNSSMKRNGM